MADSNKGEELGGMKYQEDTVRSRRKYIEYRSKIKHFTK